MKDNLDRINELRAQIDFIRFELAQLQPRLIPMDGTTGQVLAKANADSYNVQWSTAGGPGGGKTMREILKQQILTDK